MRQARAWMTGEFWPATAEEFFAVAENPADPHNAWLRQVLTYWEMGRRWCCMGRFRGLQLRGVFSAGQIPWIATPIGQVCADPGGQARYLSLLIDGQDNPDAAWYYPDPKPAARKIKGYVAFWRGVEIEP
jgi:hypothetical protein